uniref:Uncharacterized protein n=1 Tax=Timema douglasi TaxID=61478 RepID=A0A7R8Z9S6_TIMDO|nr:unnamed protein product [Timema douglasi]
MATIDDATGIAAPTPNGVSPDDATSWEMGRIQYWYPPGEEVFDTRPLTTTYQDSNPDRWQSILLRE